MQRALFLPAVLLAGCVCCQTETPYEDVPRGGTVDLGTLEILTCVEACMIKIDLVNSHRQVVRLIYEGNPDVVALPVPLEWDTLDDEGNIVPEDTYVVRVWRDREKTDSLVVFVYE